MKEVVKTGRDYHVKPVCPKLFSPATFLICFNCVSGLINVGQKFIHFHISFSLQLTVEQSGVSLCCYMSDVFCSTCSLSLARANLSIPLLGESLFVSFPPLLTVSSVFRVLRWPQHLLVARVAAKQRSLTKYILFNKNKKF